VRRRAGVGYLVAHTTWAHLQGPLWLLASTTLPPTVLELSTWVF
jgi:hypothetical protein